MPPCTIICASFMTSQCFGLKTPTRLEVERPSDKGLSTSSRVGVLSPKFYPMCHCHCGIEFRPSACTTDTNRTDSGWILRFWNFTLQGTRKHIPPNGNFGKSSTQKCRLVGDRLVPMRVGFMIGISEKSGSRGYEVSPQWIALNKESKLIPCTTRKWTKDAWNSTVSIFHCACSLDFLKQSPGKWPKGNLSLVTYWFRSWSTEPMERWMGRAVCLR